MSQRYFLGLCIFHPLIFPFIFDPAAPVTLHASPVLHSHHLASTAFMPIAYIVLCTGTILCYFCFVDDDIGDGVIVMSSLEVSRLCAIQIYVGIDIDIERHSAQLWRFSAILAPDINVMSHNLLTYLQRGSRNILKCRPSFMRSC